MDEFEVIGGRQLYQWDTDRSIEVRLCDGETINEVHYAHAEDDIAPVVKVQDYDGRMFADIPNILLQRFGTLKVWAVVYTEDGRQTLRNAYLSVRARAKPDDYVYTETEIMDYRKVAEDLAELVQRVEEIEENGVQGGGAVASVNGKTGEVYLNAADVGALPTTGGKLTGNLTVPRLISTAADADGNIYEVQLYPTANGGLYMPLRHNGAVANAMSMSQSATTFGKPVAISSGGHGGKNAAEGRQNLSLYSKEEIDEKITNTQKEIERLTEEMADELAKRGQLKPEFANSIEECTDTSKLYVLPDGYIYAYSYIERPAYTNLADPTSADWLTDKRFATYSIDDFTGAYITNHIPCKPGDTIRMKGADVINIIGSSYPRTRMFNNGSPVGSMDYYSRVLIEAGYGSFDNATGISTFRLLHVGGNPPAADGSEITGYTFDSIRQNFKLLSGYTVNDVIITVNQEIVEGIVKEYAWANTGHAFIPADYEGRIIALEEEAAENESRIEQLEAKVDGESVPDYWLDELEGKADAIQQAMEAAGRNKSAFLWYTDAHWPNSAKVSPALLDYLVRNTPMNKVNFGGDIVGDPTSFTHENIKYVFEWRKMIAGLPNHHSVPGNHDLNHNTTDVRSMAYAFLLAYEESADKVCGDGLYYYIDNPSEKTRYIYLDYMTNNHDAMVAQGRFIVDAIKGVQDGWHIVMIAHRWFQYSSVSTPTVGSVPLYETDILSVLDAYNDRKTRAESNYFGAQDFTGAKGKVEFCIGGHIHIDHDFETAGGIQVIITASDTNQERSPNDTEDSGTKGTITEAAVYGIVADYTNGKINVIGVGRGGSREITISKDS